MKALPKGLSIIEHKDVLLVKLYNTLIAKVDFASGNVSLDSGLQDIGRLTNHTKKCLNLALEDSDISVRQENFKWIISHIDVDKVTKFYYLDTMGKSSFNMYE